MATATAHVRSLREARQARNARERAAMKAPHLGRPESERKSKSNPAQRMQKTVRYERYSRNWSILSNVAAIVSISGALFAAFRKTRRSWF